MKTIMVASGKGGTGKSTVSVFLGARLAAHGKRVLLIELDSGLRSVDIIAGVCGKTVYDLEDVLCERCSKEKAVVESPLYPGLSVISAPYAGGEITKEALQQLCLAREPFFDIVVLDTAAGMGAPFQAAKACASQALLVLTPDPVALRDGRIVSDALFDSKMPEIRLIINRVTPKTFQQGAVRDLDECIDTVCAQLIGVLPESPELQIAAAKGTTLPTDCLAFTALDNIARRLEGERITLSVQ